MDDSKTQVTQGTAVDFLNSKFTLAAICSCYDMLLLRLQLSLSLSTCLAGPSSSSLVQAHLRSVAFPLPQDDTSLQVALSNLMTVVP